MSACNDWQIDELAGSYPGRVIPLCILPLWDPDACVVFVAAEISDDVISKITWENACRFYNWDPFKHTPKLQTTVAALRALATDVDTSVTTTAQYRERYLASAH